VLATGVFRGSSFYSPGLPRKALNQEQQLAEQLHVMETQSMEKLELKQSSLTKQAKRALKREGVTEGSVATATEELESFSGDKQRVDAAVTEEEQAVADCTAQLNTAAANAAVVEKEIADRKNLEAQDIANEAKVKLALNVKLAEEQRSETMHAQFSFDVVDVTFSEARKAYEVLLSKLKAGHKVRAFMLPPTQKRCPSGMQSDGHFQHKHLVQSNWSSVRLCLGVVDLSTLDGLGFLVPNDDPALCHGDSGGWLNASTLTNSVAKQAAWFGATVCAGKEGKMPQHYGYLSPSHGCREGFRRKAGFDPKVLVRGGSWQSVTEGAVCYGASPAADESEQETELEEAFRNSTELIAMTRPQLNLARQTLATENHKLEIALKKAGMWEAEQAKKAEIAAAALAAKMQSDALAGQASEQMLLAKSLEGGSVDQLSTTEVDQEKTAKQEQDQDQQTEKAAREASTMAQTRLEEAANDAKEASVNLEFAKQSEETAAHDYWELLAEQNNMTEKACHLSWDQQHGSDLRLDFDSVDCNIEECKAKCLGTAGSEHFSFTFSRDQDRCRIPSEGSRGDPGAAVNGTLYSLPIGRFRLDQIVRDLDSKKQQAEFDVVVAQAASQAAEQKVSKATEGLEMAQKAHARFQAELGKVQEQVERMTEKAITAAEAAVQSEQSHAQLMEAQEKAEEQQREEAEQAKKEADEALKQVQYEQSANMDEMSELEAFKYRQMAKKLAESSSVANVTEALAEKQSLSKALANEARQMVGSSLAANKRVWIGKEGLQVVRRKALAAEAAEKADAERFNNATTAKGKLDARVASDQQMEAADKEAAGQAQRKKQTLAQRLENMKREILEKGIDNEKVSPQELDQAKSKEKHLTSEIRQLQMQYSEMTAHLANDTIAEKAHREATFWNSFPFKAYPASAESRCEVAHGILTIESGMCLVIVPEIMQGSPVLWFNMMMTAAKGQAANAGVMYGIPHNATTDYPGSSIDFKQGMGYQISNHRVGNRQTGLNPGPHPGEDWMIALDPDSTGEFSVDYKTWSTGFVPRITGEYVGFKVAPGTIAHVSELSISSTPREGGISSASRKRQQAVDKHNKAVAELKSMDRGVIVAEREEENGKQLEREAFQAVAKVEHLQRSASHNLDQLHAQEQQGEEAVRQAEIENHKEMSANISLQTYLNVANTALAAHQKQLNDTEAKLTEFAQLKT